MCGMPKSPSWDPTQHGALLCVPSEGPRHQFVWVVLTEEMKMAVRRFAGGIWDSKYLDGSKYSIKYLIKHSTKYSYIRLFEAPMTNLRCMLH